MLDRPAYGRQTVPAAVDGNADRQRTLRRRLLAAQDEQRFGATRQHGVRHRAEHQAFESGVSARAHHDQVGATAHRHRSDGVRTIADRVARAGRDARPLQAIQRWPQHVVGLGALKRLCLLAPDGPDDTRGDGGLHVDQLNRGLLPEQGRTRGHEIQGRIGVRAAIDRDQDLHAVISSARAGGRRKTPATRVRSPLRTSAVPAMNRMSMACLSGSKGVDRASHCRSPRAARKSD